MSGREELMQIREREGTGVPAAGLLVPPMTTPPRILVLEDQPEIRSLVAAMLSIRGLSCDAAGSLAEARWLVARSQYDIFFLDVRLPDGCGLSLAEESAHPPLTVVITGCR